MKRLSVQFFEYNSRNYLAGFEKRLRPGDVIELCEFNTDTQLWDILVKSEEKQK